MKNILVTGGASGIGHAACTRLAAPGVQLWNLDLASSPVNGINNIHCDLGDPANIEPLLPDLPGELNSVIHVAGIARHLAQPKRVFNVNFFSMRGLTEALAERISPGGSVVIVASSAGRDWRDNYPLVADILTLVTAKQQASWLDEHIALWRSDPYKLSKQCAAAYTYLASHKLQGIRVNCVNPGITSTPLSHQFRDLVGSTRYDQIVAQTGRPGQPEEIAQIIEFLALGECQWLNGTEITVDGGYYAGNVALDLMARA